MTSTIQQTTPLNRNDNIINTNLCLARKNQKNDINIQCPNKRKYGDFCGKHKNYKYKKINETIESNTKIASTSKSIITVFDYVKVKTMDFSMTKIKNSCKNYRLLSNKKIKTFDIKKQRKILEHFFEVKINALNNINKVIFLQNKIRKWIIDKNLKLRGPAVKNRQLCNNSTDFYTFDNLEDIEERYFFSYKDIDSFIYGFNIESFIELLSQSRNNIYKNPYNRNRIPQNVIERAQELWKKVETSNITDEQNKLLTSKNIKIRVYHKTVKTFQIIDLLGYQTNINWIINSDLKTLKLLYKKLVNYWNYKAGFSRYVRNRIVPNCNLFNNRPSHSISKYNLMEIVIDKIYKIISSGLDDNDKQMGVIMVLMAMGEVYTECSRVNSWLN